MMLSLWRWADHHAKKRLHAALSIHQAVLSNTFSFAYPGVFGAFPQDRVFSENAVDPKGILAPLPLDPHFVTPRPSADVVVAVCSESHPLPGELQCLARRGLEPGLVIPYAGELYMSQQEHDLYSSTYSCNAKAGMVVDGSKYCNEATFVNHYSGIAAEPNCRIDISGEFVAAILVTRAIDSGEELLLDYGLQFCLRNQLPHPDAEAWARDLAALSLLTQLSNRIASLRSELADLEKQWKVDAAAIPLDEKSKLLHVRAQATEMQNLGIVLVRMDELSETGVEQVQEYKQDLSRQMCNMLDVIEARLKDLKPLE